MPDSAAATSIAKLLARNAIRAASVIDVSQCACVNRSALVAEQQTMISGARGKVGLAAAPRDSGARIDAEGAIRNLARDQLTLRETAEPQGNIDIAVEQTQLAHIGDELERDA